MRENFTDITIVLDRSGSMQSVAEDTMGGYNTFIEKQRATPGDCCASLVQFDDVIETVYSGKPIAEVPKLTRDAYQPRASTALLDALGQTIIATGERFKALPETQRATRVLFVIITDGQENASRKYSRSAIFDMIKLQRETYKWEFVFLGANQDAIATAASMAIPVHNSMTYAANSVGTRSAFDSVGTMSASFKAGATASASFSDEDREEQAKAGAANP